MKAAIIYIVLATALTGSASADVKIKTKQTSSGSSTESTTYIKGKRQRTEMGNGILVSIMQCDLRRDLQLAPQTKSYTISYYTDENGNPTVPVSQGTTEPVKKGGVVNVTTTIKDTGERKQMFGYTARHIIQTVEMESSADACYPQKTKMEMDMWVIDAEFGLACTQSYGGRTYNGGKAGGCQDRYVSKTIGTAKTGYPVYQKMTSFDPSGKESFSMPALFEAPADYREVKDASQLYAAAPTASSNSSSSAVPGFSTPSSADDSSSGVGANIKAAAQQPSANSNAVAPKKPGTVRVGVIVRTGSVGDGIAAADLAKAIQNSFGQFVKGTKVEIVSIETKLQDAQAAELKEKECDYVMLATASHKKGGGFGGFGRMLSSVAPIVGGGSVVAHVATSAVVTAATLSGSMKAKDEVTLDVAMTSPAHTSPVLAKQFKAKAKGDGDDIISSVIGQAAQSIIETVGK